MKKKMLLSLAMMLGLAAAAKAAPYFRPLNLGNISSIRGNTGALVDVRHKAPNEAVGMVPLYSHSTEDGCLLPSVVCEDWSPLAFGVGGHLGGSPFFALGPSVNLLPAGRGLALAALNYVSKDEQLLTIKSALTPAPASSGALDLGISVGPTWVVVPAENWKGRFYMFFGGVWKFGRKPAAAE